MFFQDLLAAIAVVINGLPQGLLSLTYGFGLLPTGIGFLVGIIGMVVFRQVAPISFQAEAIVLVGRLGKNRNERLNIVFFTGILMAIIGGLGLLNPTIEFIGPAILNGMMAGVGIMLARTAIDMTKENKLAGGVSIATAFLVYFLTDNNLIYTIIISVFVSTIVYIIKEGSRKIQGEEDNSLDLKNEKLRPLKITINSNVIRSVLGLVTLQIGGNIAYASVTGNIANSPVNVDQITLYSGLADSAGAFFGGGPVEAVISGTAAAPNPIRSGVLMMAILAGILFIKILPKIAKYVPNQSIAGFLFVLGALVVFPDNALIGLNDAPLVAGITTIVTSATDPFIGMIAGLILKLLIGL